LKECDSSGARDGDRDGCTSHVHASSILLSSLAGPDWFSSSPSGHAVFNVTFKEGDSAGVSITASLEGEGNQARVRNDEVFIVLGEFTLVGSGGSRAGIGNGQRKATCQCVTIFFDEKNCAQKIAFSFDSIVFR